MVLQVRILKRPVRMSPVARSLKGSQQSQSSRNPWSLGGLWWDQCFKLRIAEEKTCRDLLLSYWKVLGPKSAMQLAMQLAVPQSSCPVSQRCDISHFCQKNLLWGFQAFRRTAQYETNKNLGRRGSTNYTCFRQHRSLHHEYGRSFKHIPREPSQSSRTQNFDAVVFLLCTSSCGRWLVASPISHVVIPNRICRFQMVLFHERCGICHSM